MDKNIAQAHQIPLRKLPCPSSVGVIDGPHSAFGNIVEESKLISVVLNNLVCVVTFYTFSSPEHPIVLGLPWFELHNSDIDWRTRQIRYPQPQGFTHKISTILVHQLREEGHTKLMFVFAVLVKSSNTTKE